MYRYKKSVTWVLLVSICLISFPIQEFFHNHDAFEDECISSQNHKCQHSEHITTENNHIGCVFLLQNSSFLKIQLDWEIHAFDSTIVPLFKTNFYFYLPQNSFTRGPPTFVI